MSWLNLNQSLNSLKGQITNFASEVLSEGNVPDSDNAASNPECLLKELEEKCALQEAEIESLKTLNEELRASLQSERLTGKNGVRDEESSWYWDPPPQANKPINEDIENQYKSQIRLLQDELSAVRERDTIDLRTDTDEELNRLREENRNLTKNLEELDNQHQLAMERLLSLKKELQKNFEVLKQEHEDLKTSNDEYVTEVKVLLEKIGERDREIESIRAIKSDYETLQHKYQNLERVHGMLRENAEKFQEENQELHEEVFKLQEQVTKLEHEVEILNKQTDLVNMVPKENYESLLKEVNDLKSRWNSNEIHLDEVNIDDNAKSVIENLKRDINDLRHKLSQKETDNQRQFDEKTIKAEKIMVLYNKYVNFELPVDYVGEIPSSDESNILYKLESVFKTLNSFKKELDVLEHKLSEKNLNANHLQTQIDDLTTENEYLTTDLQHFETELNEMKKNNDFLISEIAALKNTSKLEPIIETHEDNLVKLETELADCNRINQTFESKIKTIEKELTEVSLEKTELQKSLNDLREKYTVMIAEMETFKNQSKAVEELEHTATTETTDKLNKATEEIDEFKRRLSAATAKNEQLSIDNHIIENDKVLLTKEVDDIKQLLEKKSSEQKELESQKFALERKLQNLENKLEETFAHTTELENSNVQLKDKISVLENKILSKNNITLSPEIEQLTTEKIHLSEKLDQTIKENTMLREDIDKLKNLNKDFETQAGENLVLKNKNSVIQENITLLQSTIEKLESKIVDQDSLSNENINLRNENQNLKERKTQLEAELILTDEKIVNLEQEFDKLIIDLNEKDNLIENLNATIVQNNNNLTTLNQNITDVQNSVNVKNLEIERLNHSVAEMTEKLEIKNRESNEIQQNISRLLDEKNEINLKLSNISDEVMSKNSELKTLTTLLREQENVSLNYKSTIETKEKEIKELNQSIVELTDKLKSIDNTTHHNDEYAKLAQEKETIEKEVTEFKNLLATKQREVVELNTKSDQLEKACIEFKTAIENSTAEKNELINLINLKHNESIQYHNEIQRLNQVLMEQTNEFKRIIVEKDNLLQNLSDSCSNCDSLRVTLKEKDEIIVTLNQSFTDYEKLKADLMNANETIRQLTEKCDNLDKSLTIQLETVKHLTAENVQLSEKEQNSSRELERLRHHLLETEENYTQELMTSEQKLTECQTRLHQVEERAKQTSTVYTSNSIRANQEVETLRNQIKLLEKQREDVEARLSDAEDARSRSEAALINLQVVLEQFQLDKERDVHASTEKIRNKMEELKRQNNGLQEEIGRLNIKLEESLAGLQAASRLGDQVETKTAQINDLKEQVRTLQMSVAAAEERYYNAISNQQDKVDKNLVKNLIINYVTTPGQKSVNRTQVLRVMSTVLDFNQHECERLGLVRAANAPEGLAAEFVKFLQNESQPRSAVGQAGQSGQVGQVGGSAGSLTSRSATPSSRKSSMLGPHPIMESSHRRNPSTGSGNLLFQNIDSLETSSQLSAGSDTRALPTSHLDPGVNQTRNTEGAILKHVLNNM